MLNRRLPSSANERTLEMVEEIRAEALNLRKTAAAFRRLANGMILGGDFQSILTRLAAEYECRAMTLERDLASRSSTIY
jgi:hypothetical protein